MGLIGGSVPIKDREARLRYQREWQAQKMQDPEYRSRQLKRIAGNNRRYEGEARALLADFKRQGCRLCGENDPVVIDAHHIDPSKKRFEVSESRRYSSTHQIRNELEKCVPVCKNCHARIHAGTAVLPEAW